MRKIFHVNRQSIRGRQTARQSEAPLCQIAPVCDKKQQGTGRAVPRAGLALIKESAILPFLAENILHRVCFKAQ